MRRVMLLAVSILTVVSMAVSPALAHDRDRDCWDEDWSFWVCDRDRHDRHDFDDAEICFVPVFIPIGFWDFDDFWGWFWIHWGFDWVCLDD
jgi:hypothetical protein